MNSNHNCSKMYNKHPRKEKKWLIVFFPIISLLALIWFIIRVLPKPSRAAYPCQQIASSLGFGFLLYLFSWTGFIFFLKKTKGFFLRHRHFLALGCLAIGLVFLIWNMGIIGEQTFAFTPPETPNRPIGVARGLFPGRVVWIRNPDVIRFNGEGFWWEDDNINQEICDQMLSQSLQGLTETSTDEEAWDTLFNGEYSSSLFLSQDPVAIDSVGFDFINAEFGDESSIKNADNYLHEAALAGSPPSGTKYIPNGKKKTLSSLGVHEHWNNSEDKKYSRNLKIGDGIELIKISEEKKPGSLN